MEPLCGSLHDNVVFHWNIEPETLFEQFRTSITKGVTLTLPKTNHPFFIIVDSSLIRKGCVLFQKKDKRKVDNISYIFWIFTTNEHKLWTTYREKNGIVSSLTIYEHIFVGSDHFIKILKDHKQMFSCLTKKGNLSPKFYPAQGQKVKVQRLLINYTKG